MELAITYTPPIAGVYRLSTINDLYNMSRVCQEVTSSIDDIRFDVRFILLPLTTIGTFHSITTNHCWHDR